MVNPRVGFLELAGRFDPVQQGHGDVGHDHVGLELLGQRHELAPIFRPADDVKLRLQYRRQPLHDHGVVIGEQDSRTSRG
jgi:hypothetical protein